MSALGQKQTLARFRPKTLDRLDRDQKWSSNCGAPHEDIQGLSVSTLTRLQRSTNIRRNAPSCREANKRNKGESRTREESGLRADDVP